MPNGQMMEFQFSKEQHAVHVEVINNEPYFLAKDVCDILDLQNPSDILAKWLDEDEKLTYTIDRSGQARKMNFVNESGLYNLIFRSNKPEAKKFRKWVTNEVLPSIRKTGGYGLQFPALPTKPSYTVRPASVLLGYLGYCDKITHDGEDFYAAIQYRILLGKKPNGSSVYMFRQLEALGQAIKQKTQGQEKWFISKRAVPRLLNLRPNTVENIMIIKQIIEGEVQDVIL